MLVLVVLSAGIDTLIRFGGGCDHITIQWYALSLSFCFIIVVLSFWLFFVRCFAIMMLRLKCLYGTTVVPGTSVLQFTVLRVCGVYSNRNNSTVLGVLKKKKLVYQVLVFE